MDAIQASGHPLGFASPALYQLYQTPASSDVPAVSAQDPPVLFSGSVYLNGDDYLTMIGGDQPPLQPTMGYDDVTGAALSVAVHGKPTSRRPPHTAT